ncbi:MAG: flagellar basal body rod C-terminal domain-containing protein, partial [Miltoncostaeaceae bacterium]
VGIGGQLLVDSSTDTVNALAIDAAGAATVGGVGTTISDGSLRGLVDVRNTVVGGTGGFQDRLDTFAAALIGTVNTAHAAGFGLDGTTGNNLFAGTDASDIAVDAAVLGSTDKVAAASAAADLPGGADNAVAIGQFQFATQVIGGQTTTIGGYYQSLVASVGLEVDQSARLAAVQLGVVDAARERRESVSGVNIDEEIADMIRFQKSFNAAARMMTTVDEMLDLIVNRLGIVGR